MIAHALTIAQVMAFVHDDEFIVARIVNINRFGHRHDIGFHVVLLTVFGPHILKICRTDNQCVAAKSVFVHFRNGTGSDGLTKSHYITNHCSSSLIVVQMAGCYLHGCLLEIE